MKYDLFVLQMKMLKSYEDSVIDIEQEIDDICYQYLGVRGISYDKQPSTTNEAAQMELRLKLSEALSEPQKQLDFTILAINQLKPVVYGNISKLPNEIQRAVKMLFWEHMTYEDVGKEMGYSDHGIWTKVRREIEKI